MQANRPRLWPHSRAGVHWLLFIGVLLWLGGAAVEGAEIRHRFLAKDESRSQLLYVDQDQPARDWTIQYRGKGRDLQLPGKNRVLVSSPDGYWEFNLADGKLLKEVKGFPGAMSARRQPDGRTILACAQTAVTIYELSAEDQVLRKVPFKMASTRVIRLTPQGTFLFGCKHQLFEGNFAGEIVKTFALPEGAWAYQALRKPNGNLLVSGGYDPRLFELDPDGKVVSTMGGKASPDGVRLGYYFFGAMQVLPKGDIVVCNWTGHGANDSAKGAQLLQFNAEGNVVWQWHDPVRAGSIHGVIVLDELDPSVLNDDVNFMLGPVK